MKRRSKEVYTFHQDGSITFSCQEKRGGVTRRVVVDYIPDRTIGIGMFGYVDVLERSWDEPSHSSRGKVKEDPPNSSVREPFFTRYRSTLISSAVVATVAAVAITTTYVSSNKI